MENMSNFPLLCALLLLCVPGHIYCMCPQVETIPNFDAEKFMGRWYEVEKYLNFWETGQKCITFDYEMNTNGTVTVVNSALYRLINYPVKMFGLASFNPAFPASWLLQYSRFGIKGPSSQFSILETDYENYALTFSCYSLPLLPVNIENAWILSRTPTLDPKLVRLLKMRLSGISSWNFIFTETDQSNCPNSNGTILFNFW